MDTMYSSCSLVEEREANMVVYYGSQQPIKSKGFFLNPTSTNSTYATPSSNVFLTSKLKEVKYQTNFRWWADPQLQWDKWVNKLEPKYTHLWQKAGIFEAIMCSKYKIMKDENIMLGVSSFWCEETSTFIFPWGEATITLEDIMVLGGFSILGEPFKFKGKLDGDLGRMESKMVQELSYIRKSNGKALQSPWLTHHMKGSEEDEIEHVAFLSLWLSRFVLVSSERSIKDCVFQVAVRLARGTKIALAPAVLASIYQCLRLIKDHIIGNSPAPLTIWAPMYIVQLWVWERFSSLIPSVRNLTRFDMPRAARWNFTGKTRDLSLVMQVLKSSNEFIWRPYAIELDNWRMPSFYMADGGWFDINETQDEGLRSFAQSLKACELVGQDCIEQYQPHRVAMQFGLNQDVPMFIPRVNFGWEAAWKSYDMSSMNVKFYVPSRFSMSCFTLEYSNWWRNIQKEDTVDGKKKEGNHLSNKWKIKWKNLDNFNSNPLHANLQHREAEISHENRRKVEIDSDLLYVNEEGNETTEVVKKIKIGELTEPEKSKVENEKQFKIVLQSEQLFLNEDAATEKPAVRKTVSEVKITELASNLFNINDKEIIEVVYEIQAGDLRHDLTAIETSKLENKKQFKIVRQPEPLYFDEEVQNLEVEQKASKKEEMDGRDLKIIQLKGEISLIVAKIKYLESQAESLKRIQN